MPRSRRTFPDSHRYEALVARWLRVARRSRLDVARVADVGGLPVLALEPRIPGPHSPVYLSAGIHGDEPASTEALIAWAEACPAILREHPFVILPCLNPWGLSQNLRFDPAGFDLNRAFKGPSAPLVRALKNLVRWRRFDLAIMLHEDYDADGCYLYEVDRTKTVWGRAILDRMAAVIPPDTRRSIEGHRADRGLIRRRVNPGALTFFPEAIWMFAEHADRVLTIETPSEFALERRIAAQIEAIRTALDLLRAPGHTRPNSRLQRRSARRK